MNRNEIKSKRQEVIINLLKTTNIQTQEDFISNLNNLGYNTTQASISRDMRELGIHKIRSSDGSYKYVSPLISTPEKSSKFESVIKQMVVSADFAQNIVVIKCHSGMANAACAVFDQENLKGIVGTLSGDDTFIVITKTIDEAKDLSNKIKSIL